jgi:hypothetical protein
MPKTASVCGPGSPGTLPAGAEPSKQIRRKVPSLVRDFFEILASRYCDEAVRAIWIEHEHRFGPRHV